MGAQIGFVGQKQTTTSPYLKALRLSLIGLTLSTLASLSVISSTLAIETAAREAVIVDADTGYVMFDKNSANRMPPASMSKLMTTFVVFTRLRDGSLSLDDTFRVSENAWRKGGAKSGSSTMFLDPNTEATIEDLLRGIIVQSGNDACIVMAEGIAGSEAAFAELMTQKAKEIGMTGSNFANSTGWPHPDQYMTAADLATLALRTINEFPEYYHYYSETEFTYNKIRQRNRNPLLYKGIGADGLKTGHTNEAGYGLTASATHNERRVVLVVNGLTSSKERSAEGERLMDWAFREFNNYDLYKAGNIVSEAEVWLGTTGRIPLVIENDLTITLARKSRRNMNVSVQYDGPIPAPIVAGTPIAKLVITAPDEETITVPLLAGASEETLGVVGRLMAAINFLVWGESN